MCSEGNHPTEARAGPDWDSQALGLPQRMAIGTHIEVIDERDQQSRGWTVGSSHRTHNAERLRGGVSKPSARIAAHTRLCPGASPCCMVTGGIGIALGRPQIVLGDSRVDHVLRMRIWAIAGVLWA
jgi:hypothetical protein